MFKFLNYCCSKLKGNAKRELCPAHFFSLHKIRNKGVFVAFRRRKNNDAVNDNLSEMFSTLPGFNKVNEFDLFNYPCPFPPLQLAFYQRRVHHPNVIELPDVFTHEDNFAFVLERPEKSSDLFDYIDERDYLDEDEGRQVFSNILYAAIHCEGYGVLHQDIKTENICPKWRQS